MIFFYLINNYLFIYFIFITIHFYTFPLSYPFNKFCLICYIQFKFQKMDIPNETFFVDRNKGSILYDHELRNRHISILAMVKRRMYD